MLPLHILAHGHTKLQGISSPLQVVWAAAVRYSSVKIDQAPAVQRAGSMNMSRHWITLTQLECQEPETAVNACDWPPKILNTTGLWCLLSFVQAPPMAQSWTASITLHTPHARHVWCKQGMCVYKPAALQHLPGMGTSPTRTRQPYAVC